MSDIEFAVKRTKALEGILRRDFKAVGEGLVDLAKDAKPPLPKDLIDKIEKLSKKRNVVVHEGQNTLPNKSEFNQSYKDIKRSLEKFKRTRRYGRAPDWEGGAIAVAFVFAVLIVYFLL